VKRNGLVVVLAGVTAAVFAAGCSGGVATVDGKTVSKEKFRAYLQFKRIPAGDSAKVKKALDDYVERTAIAAAIEKQKLLDERSMEVELEEFKKEMLISRYFEKFLSDKVSDQAVANYYNTNPGAFEENRVKVAHILVRINQTMDKTALQARLTLARSIYAKVKSGMDFAEAARQYSEDKQSSERGGELGWVKQDGIDPEFLKVTATMNTGDISEPFKTAYGYHIVKVLEASRKALKPYKNVEGDIRYQLRASAKSAEAERLTKSVSVKKGSYSESGK